MVQLSSGTTLDGVLTLFSFCILSFDLTSSNFYSEPTARTGASEKAIGTADGYIAATAAANDLDFATREASCLMVAGLKLAQLWST